ncbi:hypothetical protein BGZ65_008662, partial [Modicella reniformis]
MEEDYAVCDDEWVYEDCTVHSDDDNYLVLDDELDHGVDELGGNQSVMEDEPDGLECEMMVLDDHDWSGEAHEGSAVKVIEGDEWYGDEYYADVDEGGKMDRESPLMFGPPQERPQLESESSSSDESHQQRAPRRRRRHGQPAPAPVLSDATVETSLARARLRASLFCAVCCRILFEEEAFPLRISVNIHIEENNIDWPCRQYLREPSRLQGNITACKSHKNLGENELNLMNFINRYWGNPLRRVNNGIEVIDEETPEPLRNITWNDS